MAERMFSPDGIEILRQDTGRFDRRHPVGPAIWPHFDLLWLHEGQVSLTISGHDTALQLSAPDGVLIFPDTGFSGRSVSPHAEASICHFRFPGAWPPDHLRPDPADGLAHQAMIGLSLQLSRRAAQPRRRARLLVAILDGFGQPAVAAAPEGRVDRAWRLAADRLDQIRTLADVAAQAGLSESAFRAAHRQLRGGPAGEALLALRMSHAERLLATSAMTLPEIARAVGYCHAETLSHAFQRARGVPPGAWRRTQRPFA